MLAYLGLGANLGEPRRQLAWAVAALARHPRIHLLEVSSLFRTTPVGGPPPEYLNAAVAMETDLPPVDLLAVAKALEKEAGRTPAPRNAPRVLDIDVLLVADLELQLPELQIPHPRLLSRAFVLLPLAEIAPGAHYPGSGQTLAALAAHADANGVQRLDDGAGWVNFTKR